MNSCKNMTYFDHNRSLWKTYVRGIHSFLGGLLVKSMESDGPAVLLPTLIIRVGKLLKFSVPCFLIYNIRAITAWRFGDNYMKNAEY